jgi:hypothetical protein
MYENNNDLSNAIINSVKECNLTANAISRSLGFNKATDRIKNMINNLKVTGQLVEDKSGLYTTYGPNSAIKAKAVNSTQSVEEPEVESDVEPEVERDVDHYDDYEDNDYDKIEVAEVVVATFEIPEKSFGFTITKAENPRFAYTVTTPEGKEIDLVSCERIISINQDADYRYIVSTPEDVMKAIIEYTTDKGFAHFLTKDISTNRYIASVDDVGQEVILFMEVTRHNKAGK